MKFYRILSGYKNALIPVKLSSAGKGVPKAHAMICLPEAKDLEKFDAFTIENAEILSKDSAAAEMESTDVACGGRIDVEEDFIAFDSKNKSLSEVNFCRDFEDAQKAKIQKRKTKLKQKKLAKKSRLTNPDLPPDPTLKWKTDESLLNVSSRKIAGFVVNGNFSFRLGKGVGLGFLCAEAVIRSCVEGPMQPTKLLFRNSTSASYRVAIVDVIVASVGYR